MFIFNKRNNAKIQVHYSEKLTEDPTKLGTPAFSDNIVVFSFGSSYYGTLLISTGSETTVPVSITWNMLCTPTACLYITNSKENTWKFPNLCQRNGRYYANHVIGSSIRSNEHIQITNKNDSLVERITNSGSLSITSKNDDSRQFLFYSENEKTSSTLTIKVKTDLEPEIAVNGCFSPNGPKWIFNNSFWGSPIIEEEEKNEQDTVFIIIAIICALILIGFIIAGAVYYCTHKGKEKKIASTASCKPATKYLLFANACVKFK